MSPPGELGWAAARALAHAGADPLPAVVVAVARAAGLVLAEPVLARFPVPPFDASAMDGWAVRGDGPWRVTGSLAAGDAPGPPLRPGTAVAIATGAAAPAGTDAVLPTEAGQLRGDTVTGRAEEGRHIRRAGEEVAAGVVLLPEGTRLTPSGLGLAAACGEDELAVRPAPVVRLLVTGSELVRTGAPGPGLIRDALGPLLPPAVRALGGHPAGPLHVRDDPTAVAAALAPAGESVLVTTGATARGAGDHLRESLLRAGAELLVDGVRCRPGHPMLLARLPDGRYLVGLPGNPLAALVGIVTLLAPLLAGLRGLPLAPLEPARVDGPLDAHPGQTRLVPVRRTAGVATPTGHGGSAMLRGAAVADGLAVVRPGVAVVAGEALPVVDLPG